LLWFDGVGDVELTAFGLNNELTLLVELSKTISQSELFPPFVTERFPPLKELVVAWSKEQLPFRARQELWTL
jgi:hypothetical protein